MSEFTQNLAQMVAQARLPVIPGQRNQSFMGRTEGKVDLGHSELGRNFGAGFGAALAKSAEYNSPKKLRERAIETYNLFSDPDKFSPENRKQIISNNTAQEQFKKYSSVAPEYFQQGEDGLYDITLHQVSPETAAVKQRTSLMGEQERYLKETTPIIKKTQGIEQELKQIELDIKKATTEEQKEGVRLKIKGMIEELKSAKSTRKQTADATASALRAAEQTYEHREKMQPLEEGLMKAQTEQAKQRALYLNAQTQAALDNASAGEEPSMKETYAPLYKARLSEDMALRDKYAFTIQYDPQAYASEDINYTQGMVNSMGMINYDLSNEGTGRKLFVQMPAMFSSPTAQFWVDKSLAEGYSAFLSMLPEGDKDIGNLIAMYQKYRDLFQQTYGAYNSEIAAQAPNLKPMGYEQASKQYAYMKLRLDELLPEEDPGRLNAETREQYEKMVGDSSPIPPENLPVAGSDNALMKALRFFRRR